MTDFDVAHIREQGIDLIIIPLGPSFGRQTDAVQASSVASLQHCTVAAGFAGTVVVVWDAGGGRMGFRAPPNWHPFFRSINLFFVSQNINRTLTCGQA